jgi:GAF domain-containing protein
MADLPGRTRAHRIDGEQAALRRVATLVARAAAPEEVFAAVTEEAGRLLHAHHAVMSRYAPDGAIRVVAAWSSTGATLPVGTRASLGGRNLHTLVFQTGRAAQIDDYAAASGPNVAEALELGVRAGVAVPINVEGRLWGAMIVASTHDRPLPAGTEERLAGFTELAATAIANAQARVELRGFADEQAALRRVATLVARAAAPEEVFAAVTEEAGRLLHAHHATMSRYDPDGAIRVVAAWSSTGAAFPVGTRWSLGGRNLHTLVFQTGRAARIDDHASASGQVAETARELDFRGGVGVPISVEGRLWGVMIVASTLDRPLPAGTEERLAGFTELVATAIANAQARVELRGFADEQAALRRVATLVARAAAPEEVLAAVTQEAGRLLDTEFTYLNLFGPDGAATIVGTWTKTGTARPLPVGTRWSLGGRNVLTLVFQTGRAARIDDYAGVSGQAAEAARERGVRSVAGVPVSVEGRLWGALIVASTHDQPLPADTEERLAGFTELAATAIANAQARVELRGFADEQAALRRVATLVARAAAPEEVLAAVTEEAGRLLHAHHATMNRYDPHGAITVVAAWSSTGAAFPVGTRWSIGGRNLHTLVFHTGRAARIDDYAGASGLVAEAIRGYGLRAGVAVPISVEGRLWGVMAVSSTLDQPPPAGTEERLAGFTELAATAIANAESQAALTASRARIVATTDATRRRIERDLHDGVQQHLVSLALQLRDAKAAAPPGAGDLEQQLDGVAGGLDDVLDELREIARGIHPAILAEGGLRPALKTLARRSTVPVRLDVRVDERLPDQIEIAAYYVVAEALTNIAKHAHASVVDVQVTTDGDLQVSVRDDGRGGAGFGHGSGLVGLRDRAEALGGQLLLHSAPGTGTRVQVSLPLHDPGGPGLPPAATRRDHAADPDPGPPGPAREHGRVALRSTTDVLPGSQSGSHPPRFASVREDPPRSRDDGRTG